MYTFTFEETHECVYRYVYNVYIFLMYDRTFMHKKLYNNTYNNTYNTHQKSEDERGKLL